MTIPFKMEDITSLMPMPISSVRLAEMVSDPNSTVKEFARVIELDQALTANVLRWANSAASHPTMKINTVRKAVIRLGAANVLKLTMGQHLLASFSEGASGSELAENELWRHGVASAMCSEQLEATGLRQIPGMAFTAALMHDVGKLLLGRRVGYDALTEVVSAIRRDKQVGELDAEREVVGTDHAELGGEVTRYWKFPDALVNAIANHHMPNPGGEVLVDAVIVSNGVAKRIQAELGTAVFPDDEEFPNALQRLGMGLEDLPVIQERINYELNRSESLWKTP